MALPKQRQDELLANHKRLLEGEINKYATRLPRVAVEVEAGNIARKAAETYDPSVGAFSTHLVNQLRKLSRMNTQYGNLVHVPEAQQFKINKLNQVEENLRGLYGRDPTVAEIAAGSEMSLAAANHLLKHRSRDISSGEMEFTPTFINQGGAENEWLHFVYHDLPERDKLIFEHKTGFGNKAILGNDALAKKLNTTTSVVNSRFNMIAKKIGEGLN